MPLIVGAQSAVAPLGYSIDNSCMFDKESDDYLSRTFGSGGDLLKWTYSCWVKRNNTLLSNHQLIGGGYFTDIKFRVNDMHFGEYDGGYVGEIITDRIFRDTSAWYHFVFVWDSHNAAAGNRMRIYCNGVEETSFSGDVEPPLDQASKMNTAAAHTIASNRNEGGTADCDVYLADCIFIDGEAYAASDFGEFSEDSPSIWVPKDPSDLTMTGTSFWLDFANSADLGNDVSGNSNDWTSNNIDATNQATDTPTNNFCTMDPVATTSAIGNTITFSEGSNLITNTSSGAWQPAVGTMAANAGKWYAEFKVTAVGSGTKYAIIDVNQYNERVNFADTSRAYSYEYNAGAAVNNSNWTDYWGDTFTTGDIIGIAMDLDNMKLYFSKAGVWQDSGDPTSGATGTGTHTYFGGASNSANAAGVDWYAFAANFHNNSVTGANFGGCPGFAITSGNADGNGYGNFEYAVPSGYYAMCTKNLGEFGG